MAPKTFTCNICNAEVSKPKSFAHLDGRACKHHQEAQDANASREQARANNLAAHKNKPRSWEKGFVEDPIDAPTQLSEFGIRDPNSYCWCCKKPGLYSHEFAKIALTAMGLARISGRGHEDVFSPDSMVSHIVTKVINQMGLKEAFVFKRFPIERDYPEWKLKQLVKDHTLQSIAQATMLVVLCTDCSKEYEFNWFYDHPKVDPANLAALSAVAREVGNKWAVEAIVKDLLDHNQPEKE